MSNATGIGSTIVPPAVGNVTVTTDTFLLNIEYVDFEGEVSTTRLHVRTTNPSTPIDLGEMLEVAAEFATKHAAMSNAQVRRFTIGPEYYVTQNKPPAPSVPDGNIEEKTFLLYETATGEKVSTQVPSALHSSAVYLGDDETVNPAATGPSQFSADAVTGFASGNGNDWFLSTALGIPVQSYIKGYARRAKTRRRQRQGISTEIGG